MQIASGKLQVDRVECAWTATEDGRGRSGILSGLVSLAHRFGLLPLLSQHLSLLTSSSYTFIYTSASASSLTSTSSQPEGLLTLSSIILAHRSPSK
ncbi:hypothetical protein Pcinc_031176 [Petrolisthes cinctipes]|uniref:Uncharacterized protein n=1 Tax=Petrolisthes cinctipes TaxID=88211 RepID=A0AAE1EX59_PETCI|nr:hypothetical protein Pcinc_031176 [Petrolisthes cinctipes]